MGQLLHKCAKTTFRIRKEIQESKESIASLANKYSINVKTVSKWKNRLSVEDIKMGPKRTRTVLKPLEEAIIVEFRKKTLLPLDDIYISLKDHLPTLTRSNLHRCLQRHGVSRLPFNERQIEKKKEFKKYQIGFFHIDICEIQIEKEKCYLFVAIDRTSKFTFAQIYPKQNVANASNFLKLLVQIVPYKIHKVLTDNGIQFSDHAQTKERYKLHQFTMTCQAYGIEHRLTKVRHPWTNGQVERMNRTIKEATIKIYHYEDREKISDHVNDYLLAYNYGKRLRSLKFQTPFEFICKQWIKTPKLFLYNPHHHLMGPNT